MNDLRYLLPENAKGNGGIWTYAHCPDCGAFYPPMVVVQTQ